MRELRNILSVAAAQAHQDGQLYAKNIAEVIRCMKSRRKASSCRRRASDFGLQEPSPRTSLRRRATDAGAEQTASQAEPAGQDSLENLESRHIAELLKLHHGNRRQVAAALGISERTMYRKLKRYGLT